MNHVLENTLIVVVILAIIALPFYVASKNLKRKRIQKFNEILADTAAQNGIAITRQGFIGERLLGWSAASRQLICIEHSNSIPVSIDLQPVKNCRMVKQMNGTVVQSISLKFYNRNGNFMEELVVYKQFADNEMKLKAIARDAAEWEHVLTAEVLQTA